MSAFKLGDRVSVIHESIDGEIILINGGIITIQDQEGFTREYRQQDLAKIQVTEYSIHHLEDKDVVPKKVNPIVQNPDFIKRLKAYEIDLHIEELTDDTNRLSNAEIIQKQMTACKGFVENAILNHKKRLVLIHGKGEGVLKAEIHLYLNKIEERYGVKCTYNDAPADEYGFGATEVKLYV